MYLNQLGHVIVEVIHGNVLERAFRAPRDEAVIGFLHLEEDLEDRHNQHEREDVQYG
jgi:hypothetical protein